MVSSERSLAYKENIYMYISVLIKVSVTTFW